MSGETRWALAYLAALASAGCAASLIFSLANPDLETPPDGVILGGLTLGSILAVVFLPLAAAATFIVGSSRDWRLFVALGALTPTFSLLGLLLLLSGDPLDISLLLRPKTLDLIGLTAPSGALGGFVFHQVWTRMEAGG